MSFHLATNRNDVILPGLAPELPHSHAFTAAEAAQNSKIAQLKAAQVAIPEDGSSLTTHTGAGVDNTTEWLKAGARGPSDLSDLHGREKIHHFDRAYRRQQCQLTSTDERIPERVVHARGTGAHGTFKLHTSLADVTCAKIFTEVGNETPLFVRFSTVLGSRGSADTVRDTRGFAIKMYTDDGNWDLVGNNIPVFFINEGIQFPDVIHAGKPEPHNEIPQAQTAHDNFWDWLSLSPQALHHAFWALSDRGIPRSYRHINGFGVNSFLFVKEDGSYSFVKFHIKPHLGTHSLVWDEALKLAGQDPDFHRRDLYDSIEAGAYPKYELGVQVVDAKDEHSFDFDLLDCTKLIPEELVPVKYVGTIELNRVPSDFFSETENVAFCTGNIVRGIDYSNDPMLAARNFSYLDTQLSRLGHINHHSLPINRPAAGCPVISTLRDGAGQHLNTVGPNYFPNRFSVPQPASADSKAGPLPIKYVKLPVEGFRERANSDKFKNDHFSQPRLFYNSLSDVEKAHFIAAAQFEWGRCSDRTVRTRILYLFNEVDHDLAVAIGQGLDIEVPAPSGKNGVNEGKKSAFLSQLSEHNTYSPAGKKVAIFALDGYDGAQVAGLVNAVRAGGNIPMIVGTAKGFTFPAGTTRKPKGLDEGAPAATSYESHFTPETGRSTLYDGLIFPSGDATYEKQLKAGRVVQHVIEAYGHLKAIAGLGVAADWIRTRCLPGEIADPSTADSYVVQPGVILAPASREGADGIEGQSGVISKLVGAGKAVSFFNCFTAESAKHRAWTRDVSNVPF